MRTPKILSFRIVPGGTHCWRTRKKGLCRSEGEIAGSRSLLCGNDGKKASQHTGPANYRRDREGVRRQARFLP